MSVYIHTHINVYLLVCARVLVHLILRDLSTYFNLSIYLKTSMYLDLSTHLNLPSFSEPASLYGCYFSFEIDCLSRHDLHCA